MYLLCIQKGRLSAANYSMSGGNEIIESDPRFTVIRYITVRLNFIDIGRCTGRIAKMK